MKSMLAGFTATATLFGSMAIVAQETEEHTHWTYNGKDGPNKWAALDPAYSECKLGHHQSPIDIRHTEKADLPPIQFDYRASPLTIIDNGHTVMVDYAPGSFITVGDHRYQLTQFHFHHPSEEHINGKGFDMVVRSCPFGCEWKPGSRSCSDEARKGQCSAAGRVEPFAKGEG